MLKRLPPLKMESTNGTLCTGLFYVLEITLLPKSTNATLSTI